MWLGDVGGNWFGEAGAVAGTAMGAGAGAGVGGGLDAGAGAGAGVGGRGRRVRGGKLEGGERRPGVER
eukprot:766920-Hanusia_phi.AAC.3